MKLTQQNRERERESDITWVVCERMREEGDEVKYIGYKVCSIGIGHRADSRMTVKRNEEETIVGMLSFYKFCSS